MRDEKPFSLPGLGSEPAPNLAAEVDATASLRFQSALAGRPRTTEAEKANGTVMHVAAGAGAKNALAALLEGGGDHTKVDANNRTPLFYACKGGHTGAARVLIDAGAKLDAADNSGLTPCMAAAAMGHLDCVSLLLDSGAAVNYASGEGYSPLHAAAQGGHKEMLELLVGRGAGREARTRDEGHTPLHVAARFGCVSALHSLLSLGADPGALSKDGGGLFHTAATEAQPAVVKALLLLPHLPARRALLSGCDFTGRNPLHAAVVAASSECVSILLPLCLPGCGPSSSDSPAPSAAAAAASAAEDDCDGLFVDAPTRPRQEGTKHTLSSSVAGKTALHLACERGLLRLANWLLAAGALPSRRDAAGQIPLHAAAAFGHVVLIEKLAELAVGQEELCGVDTRDGEGRTPLRLAVERGCTRTSEALLLLGASAVAVAEDGKSPLDVARERHPEKVRLIASLGGGGGRKGPAELCAPPPSEVE